MTTQHTRFTFERHLEAADRRTALISDVMHGLTSSSKYLRPKWFYDAQGSLLFDEITQLDEYYPTEAERIALTENANEIVALSGADTLVELGSGSSDKTRVLLDAFTEKVPGLRYVPLDVSESALRSAASVLINRYPTLNVHAIIGDFDAHIPQIPSHGTRMIAFLGGTIGNYLPVERESMLRTIAQTLRSGETFLLGTDLVKDPTRLVAAYDDTRGITAAFNRNVLAVLNRELGANFVPRTFAHVAKWDSANEWIEMRLRSTKDQLVTFTDLNLTVPFRADEEMRTEISAKFRPPGVRSELAAAGFTVIGWWTDPKHDFALSLSRRN